jgi:hypothetical protein
LESHLSLRDVRGEVSLTDAQAVTNRPADVRGFERTAS